jgi:hypothetical protein
VIGQFSEEALERRWNDLVCGRVFDEVSLVKPPTLVTVGGQPGAGKTLAIGRIQLMYPSHMFTVINGDDLRQFHPRFDALRADPDPEVMPRETAALSGWMIRRALQHAAQIGCASIVEGTFREPTITLRTVRDFRERGFDTHVVALGVPEASSWQGCVSRYIDAVGSGKPARWAPKVAHDLGYEGTPRTVEAAENDLNVTRLSVVDRDGNVAFDNTRDSDGQWSNPTGARQALDYLRTHPSATRLAEFDAAQRRLTEQATQLLLPREAKDAVAALEVMGQALRSM